ncbi:protein kinase family protein [Peribacillus saganii]|uniref:Protein kinase family protein n=1 Tax=Peribacillus saganii TaxID=2303992 RepID=A0A372LAE8_9BACI|nr:protein kinase family protein [Peribacillus saganii]RFU62301.1 protein kinase family protein [Peribacillus saganii]
MKPFLELAQSVKFDSKGMLLSKDTCLRYIGRGRSAYVFRIGSTYLVMKVFLPERTREAKEEAEIYRILQKHPSYPALHGAGENYLVIDYIKGATMYQCLNSGMEIRDEHVQQVDQALESARRKGLNPSDIHLHNIIIIKNSQKIKVIDVARYRQQKECSQWEDIKKAYVKYYRHRYFPKKIPRFVLDAIAVSYKKNLLRPLI